jgi:hypothetical protein
MVTLVTGTDKHLDSSDLEYSFSLKSSGNGGLRVETSETNAGKHEEVGLARVFRV